ncbi:response regulator transcription factor [Clostridium sp. 19966]|uniref:response regulator transcription factor n=1 Tax=Clostridium sp. 19966 TaxID=2768166 RepID=UPI0028E0392A|nr:response regulator transcription factor [Clostridium sp. 19966]MDT8715672.1 response regulator transcription factor [Clostridium sp. 19966]
MILKVLIVDDEPLVREGLKSIIDWGKYGFQVCGEASDGKDALNKIINLNPNLVLMDIKMPGITGLDVIKNANSMGYSGKYIILTGYSDFEYAKSSISLGVSSYILKPIDDTELEEIVDKIHNEFEKEEEINRQLEKSNKYVKEKALKNIITGTGDSIGLSMDKAALGFSKSVSKYSVATIEFYQQEIVDISDGFIERIYDFIPNKSDVEVAYIADKMVILFEGLDYEDTMDILEKLYERLFAKLFKNVLITKGMEVCTVEEISESYKNALDLAKRKFFFEDKNIISGEYLEKELLINDNSQLIISDFIEEVYTYIEVYEEEKINENIEILRLYLLEYIDTEAMVKTICSNIHIGIIKKIAANYTDKYVICDYEDIIKDIYGKENLSKLMEYLKQELINISKNICDTTTDNIIKRMIAYIQKNYYKPLRLESLAELFNYNSAYLGKLFKSHTGENFNSYLDKIRIENAKHLLMESDIKVYQVSEKVGYKNIDYFYEKFKKYVGVSPKEYKKIDKVL